MNAGYRQIDHTADLALELWAPTEVALLQVGVDAVRDILTEGADIADTASRAAQLETVDPGDRLVQWLNEIVFAAVTDGFVCSRADIELFDGGLRAEMHGEENAAARVVTELKSATYHDLDIGPREGGWHARIVIDV